MRIALIFVAATLGLMPTGPVAAQALRHPADPPAHTALRPPPTIRELPTDVTRPVDPVPALSPQQRCLHTAERAVQPVSDQRIAAAQRGLGAAETRRTATGGDVTDPTDRSGLRAQREAQQRAIARERGDAAQRLAVARANCR